jgi:hypothetical protein
MPTATNIQGYANGDEYIGMILATSKGSPLDNLVGERDGPARTRVGRNLAGTLAPGRRRLAVAPQSSRAPPKPHSPALPAGTERDVLRYTATRLAGDLGLPWLLALLRDDLT